MLCLAFGSSGITYAGTLSGDIYKWEKNNLVGTVQGHEVLLIACFYISFTGCIYEYNLNVL